MVFGFARGMKAPSLIFFFFGIDKAILRFLEFCGDFQLEGKVKRGVWVCDFRSKQKRERGRCRVFFFFLSGEMSSKKRQTA